MVARCARQPCASPRNERPDGARSGAQPGVVAAFCFERAFQIVANKPRQADRALEGGVVGTGSRGCLLQQERQQAEVKDFETDAVIDGAAKAGKALLGFWAVPGVLPLFLRARFACRGELARRALACSGTGLREIARRQFSRPLVPPDMKMQPGQLMEQVPQRSGKPLL